MNFTKETLIKWKNCVGREVGLRKSVYPKWVKQGRMKQETADLEIVTMSEIYYFLKGLAEEKEKEQ